MAQAAGFKTWTELFANKNAPPENPERPTMAAWAPTSRASDPIFTLKRNPYYVGVDKAGNQLPYIDEVRFTYFADAQALNLAAIAGEFDMQERHINMTNYPVLKEQEKTGKYKIITWSTFGGADAVIAFNQTYTADPEMGKVMANKDFRIALSLAINREQIKESVFLGLGEPRQAVPAPWHPYYPGDEYAKKYTEFNRDQANKMLDGIGLNKKDADGIRLLPERQARHDRDLRRPGVRRVARRGAAGLQGLGDGRRQDHRADPRARAALQDEREQRADGRDLERGHQRPSRSPATPSPIRATRRSSPTARCGGAGTTPAARKAPSRRRR